MRQTATRDRSTAAPRSRSAAEGPLRTRVRQRVAAHPGGRHVAQLAALANAGGGIVQRWASPPPIPTAKYGGPLPATTAFQPLPTARKTFRGVGSTSAPADPGNAGEMAHWKGLGVLADPSKGGRQALTRMHAIRGRFGGPCDPTNMFLGTALSNNFSADSHYKLVEEPLEKYVTKKPRGETRAVEYSVTPNRDSMPGYIHDRIATLPPAEQQGFEDYANAHIPDRFDCNATLYRQDASGDVYRRALDTETLSAMVGAPAGPAPALPVPGIVPAAVGTALGPVASVHAAASESGALGAAGYGVAGATAGAGLAAGYAAGLGGLSTALGAGYAAVAAHGVTGALAAGYTAVGGLSGALAAGAAALSGPVGWTALGLGALGAYWGYTHAEHD